MEYKIIDVDYNDDMIDLFVRSGLEIHYGEPRPKGLLNCYALCVEGEENPVGYGGLVLDQGTYVLRCVAVEDAYRGNGFGAALVNAVVREAFKRGAKDVFLTAKVPGFYEKMGFKVIPREEAPFVSKCFECPQFHQGCESEVMQIKK